MDDDGRTDLVLACSYGVAIRFQDPVASGKFLPATAIPQ